MLNFKRLGVFLHDSPADRAALAYAGVIATLAQSESVFCTHVRESADESEPQPDIETLQNQVRQQLPGPVARITHVDVQNDTGVASILRTARDDELDLIIVGRRLPSEQIGIGSAFARLARKSPCSVLVVPTGSHPHLERLLVAVDFSDNSKRALEQAVQIACGSGAERPQLIVHSNSTVGYGYAKLGLTLSSAISQREEVTQKKLEEFVANVDTCDCDVELIPTCSEQDENAILEVAVSRKMDLVVLGSRGVSAMVLLGSTTEKALIHSVLPVLIVKEKGETVGILNALFGS